MFSLPLVIFAVEECTTKRDPPNKYKVHELLGVLDALTISFLVYFRYRGRKYREDVE